MPSTQSQDGPANEAHVSLCVSEFDDPAIITLLIGLSPTEVWCVGDPIPGRSSVRRKFSRWSLGSPLSAHATLDDHLDALLLLIEPVSARVRGCAIRFHTGITCAVYYHQGFTQGIHLSKSLLRRVSELGVPLDFDLYFLAEGVVPQDVKG
ncbi:hypothetical protein BH09VER1_BH09VER1_02260 [soil metagenome]